MLSDHHRYFIINIMPAIPSELLNTK